MTYILLDVLMDSAACAQKWVEILNLTRGMHDRMDFMFDRMRFMYDRTVFMHDRIRNMYDRAQIM